MLFCFVARYKNGKKLHELFSILMSIMTDICQRQFRFLKFSFGPVCPNPRCPGSWSDGNVRPLDPSSDESDEDNDDNSTCDEACAGSPGEGRQHVICLDPAVPTRPLWCNSTPVHEFEEIFLKSIFGIHTFLSIEINILLHPGRLIKLKYSMNFSHLQA